MSSQSSYESDHNNEYYEYVKKRKNLALKKHREKKKKQKVVKNSHSNSSGNKQQNELTLNNNDLQLNDLLINESNPSPSKETSYNTNKLCDGDSDSSVTSQTNCFSSEPSFVSNQLTSEDEADHSNTSSQEEGKIFQDSDMNIKEFAISLLVIKYKHKLSRIDPERVALLKSKTLKLNKKIIG